MAKIVSFIIPKGGCGKTTTAANLAAYISAQGYRVLAVDMDPQGNLTQHLGYDTENLDGTLSDLFLKKKKTEEVLLQRDEKLHLLPNNFEIIKHIKEMEGVYTPYYLLRDTLFPIKDKYDFIIVDCPPSLGFFSINALAASTDIMLVVSPEFFPLKSIKPLYYEYQEIKEKLNLSLNLKGVLITMADMRLRHARDVVEIIKNNFKEKLYAAYIRNNVALKEAASVGMSIFEYDQNSAGAIDYTIFAEEFLRDFAPAKAKKKYYEEIFGELSDKEKSDILNLAKNRIDSYHKYVISEISERDIVKQAVLIERNKQIEKLFPYRDAKN